MTKTSVLATSAISQLFLLTSAHAGGGAIVAPGPVSECADIAGGLPLPFGVSVFYMRQESNYDVTSLHATAFGYPVPGLGANIIPRVHSTADTVNAKLDWWAQPWLNFHAIFGYVSGSADADVSLPPQLAPLLGGINGFRVNYNGIVYGGGMTLAAGYKSFFASVTGNYTWADVDLQGGSGLALNDANNMGTLVITPKVGWRFDKGSLWAGAFYQSTEHTQYGRFNSSLGSVNFNASVRDSAPWNFVMGGEFDITKHWILTGEVGLGHREQVMFGTSYRF